SIVATEIASALTLMVLSVGRIEAAIGGVVLAPGVVADPDSATAYIEESGGGLVAVDVGSGSWRWASGATALPLGPLEGRLVALEESSDGSIRVIGVDPSTGTV